MLFCGLAANLVDMNLANFGIQQFRCHANPSRLMFHDMAEVQRRTCLVLESVFGKKEYQEISLQTCLWDFGLTSILALSLSASLEDEFNHYFPAGVAFNHESVSQLAKFIYDEISVAVPSKEHFDLSRQVPSMVCSSETLVVSTSQVESLYSNQPIKSSADVQTSLGSNMCLDYLCDDDIAFDAVTMIILSAIHKVFLVADGPYDHRPNTKELRKNRAILKSAFEGTIKDIINIDEAFWLIGLTSKAASQISDNLSIGFHKDIPAVVVFDHPSINDLSAYIKRRIGSDHEDSKDINKLDISSQLEPYGIKGIVLGSSLEQCGRQGWL